MNNVKVLGCYIVNRNAEMIWFNLMHKLWIFRQTKKICLFIYFCQNAYLDMNKEREKNLRAVPPGNVSNVTKEKLAFEVSIENKIYKFI